MISVHSIIGTVVIHAAGGRFDIYEPPRDAIYGGRFDIYEPSIIETRHTLHIFCIG